MPPRQEATPKDSTTGLYSPIQDLALALNELMHMQQRRSPASMQLDTCFQFPKFSGQMNGEAMDSWICSLSTYFKTCSDLEEEAKLQIASL